MTSQAETQTPSCLSAGALPSIPKLHPPIDFLPLLLLCHLTTTKGSKEEIPGHPAHQEEILGQPSSLQGQPRRAGHPALTPMGEHFSTNFSSWDLAVPGSPSISRLMSPRRVSPSGSLREDMQVGRAKTHGGPGLRMDATAG